jgi:hypothetical protein
MITAVLFTDHYFQILNHKYLYAKQQFHFYDCPLRFRFPSSIFILVLLEIVRIAITSFIPFINVKTLNGVINV